MSNVLTLAEARRAWRARQHLSATPLLPLPELVASVGGLPCPVGATPALALVARHALIHRSTLDQAIFRDHTLALVPGPRGISWVVAATHAPSVRAVAVAEHAAREARLAAACGLSSRDLLSTRDALRAALAKPRTSDSLRDALSQEVRRDLGEAGRRAGCVTLAGLVLRGMWAVGEVYREPAEGRIDRDPWRYRLDPMPRVVPPAAEAVPRLSLEWINAHAPVSARSFAAAFSIANSRATAALKPLKLRTVTIEGLAGEHLVPEDFSVPAADADIAVDLLPVRDPFIDARPDLAGLSAPSIARSALTRQGALAPLILIDGAVAGTWAFDASLSQLRLQPVFPWSEAEIAAVNARAATLADFIAREIDAPAMHLTVAQRAPTPRTASADLEL
jgi:Winged helix DNA-binding domain